MNITKKRSKEFSIVWASQPPGTITNYINSNTNCIQWIYLFAGNLQINYTTNGHCGCYNMIPDMLADLHPTKDLNIQFVSSDGSYQFLGFISEDPLIVYDCEVISIIDNQRRLFFEQETIVIALKDNVYINNKELIFQSFVKIPKNQCVNLTSSDNNSSVIVFYKNV